MSEPKVTPRRIPTPTAEEQEDIDKAQAKFRASMFKSPKRWEAWQKTPAEEKRKQARERQLAETGCDMPKRPPRGNY
jgi:hypothetical protein